ncbi:hypothetical protein QUA44_29095 [Microcoleus sp. N9_A2]|uniref:hypothetical protein n=1 Tax=Microcoleus sp. N9_A4 TaxID=3055383 RepID=UPI002FD5B885
MQGILGNGRLNQGWVNLGRLHISQLIHRGDLTLQGILGNGRLNQGWVNQRASKEQTR